ncbi:MAG: DUF1080 domain-containing protein [Verrucomicrobia bacterium]|nr:DUF1080 domain-containing protein [Verrucomicrobiota bacterium]
MIASHRLIPFLVASALAILNATSAEPPPTLRNPRPLFDGKTLAGWEGNPGLWRVQDGALTGGSYEVTVPRNEFLATRRDFTNFIIRFEIRMTGSNGFINSGFQMRSQRVPNSSEMAGYQCDYGEPNWYGAVYDESRRNRVMSWSDMTTLRPVLKVNDWNVYVIRADGPRITTWINGVLGTDYIEADPSIPDWGKLGIQVHGGGKTVAQARNVLIQELPPTPPGRIFRGAPEPKAAATPPKGQAAVAAVAVSPEEERSRFTVAPGFEIELVASEELDAGIGKFVAVDWDARGNLWTMTALEYPVDANESPAVAKALYASRARDKILVYDRDPRSPTGYSRKARVFADGLAIPLGILPYKNGVYAQHGTEIVYLSDTDGDGKADKREVILSGFGVQDSHLFPHQFTRAPGGWIWMAQGAFNYGKVKTAKGAEVKFDETRMARFRYDGSDFDITSQGPCNIWGLFMTMEGETWIQEANDFGYPAMRFHEYANYPGCSQGVWKSYAPEFPSIAPHFAMGGTGLSGLAMSDRSGWPEAYCDVLYVANPITRKIQAIKIRPDGTRHALTKLPDFIQSSDEMFRPVALRLGPDGCLYFVDWYNKIISHNEVARNHPDRDKKHGRIWRVRHSGTPLLAVPDFTKLSGDELISRLGGENTTQSHLAWQAIGDRGLKELAPRLKGLIVDSAAPAGRRIAALWSLLGLHAADVSTVMPLLRDPSRNIRREALRALGENVFPLEATLALMEPFAEDSDPEVRAESIRVLGRMIDGSSAFTNSASSSFAQSAIALCARFALSPLAAPMTKSTQSGRLIKAGDAYEREFERYLVRYFLERHSPEVAGFLGSEASHSLALESRLLLALCLEPKASASRVAELLPSLKRAPGQEELLRLAQFPDEPGVGAALKAVLQQPATSAASIELLLQARTRLDGARITPLLNDSAKQFAKSDTAALVELGARLASAFQLTAIEPELAQALERGWAAAGAQGVLRPESLAALRALRDLKSERVDLFAPIAEKGALAEQQAAVAALASSRNPEGASRLASLFPALSAPSRRVALASLASVPSGARALVKSIRGGVIPKDEMDGATLDKLRVVLGDDAELAALMGEMASLLRPALRLNGDDEAWVDSDIALRGPFTVETWVKLDPGVDNNDGILGAPGALDMNFFGGLLRVYIPTNGLGDVAIAKKPFQPDVWTHVAVSRDAEGRVRIYQNGELDSDPSSPVKLDFEHLRVAWTTANKGASGWLSEYRVWSVARRAEEIRADFDRSFEGEPRPPELAYYSPGGGPWGRLRAGAQIVRTPDYPSLLTPAEAKTLGEKFSRFHALAEKSGDAARGQATFKAICMVCHNVGGQGGQVGPVLSGAGAQGIEALLRNILTPNAAMEAGYRVFRVELKEGDVLDGIRVKEDGEAIVLRQPNAEDLRIPLRNVRRAAFTRSSMMPEGLLEGLKPQEVTDLFAYLKTLK